MNTVLYIVFLYLNYYTALDLPNGLLGLISLYHLVRALWDCRKALSLHPRLLQEIKT